MATFTAHKAFDTTRIPQEQGQGSQVLAATPTTWRFADAVVDHTYSGGGLAYVDGDAVDGVITGWAMASNGTPLFTLTDTTFLAGPHPDGQPHDIWDVGYLGETGHPGLQGAGRPRLHAARQRCGGRLHRGRPPRRIRGQ